MSFIMHFQGRRVHRLAALLIAILAALCLLTTYLLVQAQTASASRPTPAAPAACGPTNLALHQPTTASSVQNSTFPASNATDGNLSTRWSSAFSDPQWLEVDLGSVATICQVTLAWEDAYATAFQIQVSNDNATWTTIFSTTTGTGGTQTVNVSGSGRYIRMYGTARATQYGYSLWEFEVFGTGGGSGCGKTNLALHQPTTASSVENSMFPASNATDGNLSTRWSSAFSDPQWLDVDLGSVQTICQVALYWENAYATAFKIQVSNDNATWTTIFSTTTGTGGTQTVNVSGSGRYIRVYGTKRATQYGYSLWEFQVFGPAGSGGNTVTVTKPGSQSSTVGAATSLQIRASDSASGQTLTYTATGLPAGLSINSSSGLISGTPTAAGTSNVTVTAADTTGAKGSASFSWTVNASAPAWTRVFFDHFTGPSGSRVDRKWTYDRGTSYVSSGCPANWGTGEVETETAAIKNVRLDGRGHLQIRAQRSARGWTSGRIETVSSNFAAPAGGQLRVSATIRQPGPARGLGYWPAFWMLGTGFRAKGAGTSGKMACSRWPSIGEIDVMEDVNALSEHSGTLHCGIAPGGPCHEFTGQSSGLRPCCDWRSGYHVYSVIVDRTRPGRESITWYLDGKPYFTVSESQVGAAAWAKAVDHGFFLILDLAIGGNFPNAVCACTTPTRATTSGAAMSIASVAVYTRRP